MTHRFRRKGAISKSDNRVFFANLLPKSRKAKDENPRNPETKLGFPKDEEGAP